MADRITEKPAGWYAIKLNNMGKYFSDLKIAKPRSIVYDRDIRTKLWRLSEELTGMKFSG